MGQDHRIPCNSSVFKNLRGEKDDKDMNWNGYLKWLYEQAHRSQDADNVDPDEFAEYLEEMDYDVVSNMEIRDGRFDEVLERLDRIESATKEATNAAQSAEKSVEDLKP